MCLKIKNTPKSIFFLVVNSKIAATNKKIDISYIDIDCG